MKHVYQNFEEIADDLIDGEFIFHQLSDHGSNICSVWQNAIKEFAKALDLAGIKLEENPETYDRLWEHCTEALQKWSGGISRRKPMSTFRGFMTKDEAKQRYGKEMENGERLVIPLFDFNEIDEEYYIIKD